MVNSFTANSLNLFYAAYERYALPLIPFLFIIIGVGTVATVMKISKLLISKNSLNKNILIFQGN